jgi:hypothetical protein
MQAGLFLRQGYVPENVTQIEHNIPILKQCISWALGNDNLILCSVWLYH